MRGIIEIQRGWGGKRNNSWQWRKQKRPERHKKTADTRHATHPKRHKTLHTTLASYTPQETHQKDTATAKENCNNNNNNNNITQHETRKEHNTLKKMNMIQDDVKEQEQEYTQAVKNRKHRKNMRQRKNRKHRKNMRQRKNSKHRNTQTGSEEQETQEEYEAE